MIGAGVNRSRQGDVGMRALLMFFSLGALLRGVYLGAFGSPFTAGGIPWSRALESIGVLGLLVSIVMARQQRHVQALQRQLAQMAATITKEVH